MSKRFLSKIILCLFFTSILLFAPYKVLAANSSSLAPSKDISLNNNYPIIMVHGLFGWGNDELNGKNYWGGSESLRQKLIDKGYQVYTPTIGPVSSNWDRACELYAYIKGGTVDYGEAHSKKCGHSRYGRTYPGIYPSWGNISNSKDIQKIHLIGHSMGGQTIRTLAELLKNGSTEERTITSEKNLSPLFLGNKSWVDSITTIATPHDGSQEAHLKYGLEPLVHQFVAMLAVENNAITIDNLNLDFQLDQWGLKRNSGESYRNYFDRIIKSNIWKKTNDLSVWDLTPEGARELNTWVKAQDDIYYFSLVCEDTHEDGITHHQIPDKNMHPILIPSSIFMGCYTNNKQGDVAIDKTWWKNDGIVSVISAICPRAGSTDKMVYYNDSAHVQKGVWNYIKSIKSVDHLKVVQMTENRPALEQEFFDLAQILNNLPI